MWSSNIHKLHFLVPWLFSQDSSVAPMKIISDIQSLLIAAMCHIANICFSRKFLGVDDLDDKERRSKHCFVDAAIAFFRLQHLNPNVPVKTQVCISFTPWKLIYLTF